MTYDEELTFRALCFLSVLSCKDYALNEEEDAEHGCDGDVGPPCFVKS